MEHHGRAESACGCQSPAMHLPTSSRAADSRSPGGEIPGGKYFQEIGAEMIGNQLIIRVEKDRNKSASMRRKAGQWDPPCDCGIPEIRMPSAGTKGPARIVNAGDNNQILFRIRSRNLLGKDEAGGYKPEAFAYQLGAAKKGKESSNEQHRTITVHPSLGDPAESQQVHSDHITDGNQNIYLLRVKRKAESATRRRRNIELELRTPKPPTPRRVSRQILPQRATAVVAKPLENEAPIETIKSDKRPSRGGSSKKDNKKKKKKR